MPYHHVIAKTNTENKSQCLFSDLSVEELKKNFIEPYEKGESFFSGNNLISPSDLRSIQIIVTERKDEIERDEINQRDRKSIEEFNRENDVALISPGGGYSPEDIAEAGEDLTHTFIKGPPGYKSKSFVVSGKVLGWAAGILAAVITAGIIKWLGWV